MTILKVGIPGISRETPLPILLVYFLLILLVYGVLTEYVVEFWLTYVNGTPVYVPFWACALAGLSLGRFMIPAAIVTLILSFAL